MSAPSSLVVAAARAMSASLGLLERAAVLDRVGAPLADGVRRVLGPSPALADALHGVPSGHPIHPALVLVPAGAFLSAGILDVTPGTGDAVPTLIAVGLVSAVPAAAAGLADWSQLHPQQQRVGLVHAGFNGAALVCYSASLLARARGHRAKGRVWALAGLVGISAGGYLGGHLAYRQAAGANHAEQVPHLVPGGWHDLCALDELPDGTPARRMLGETPLLLLRRGVTVHVLADACSHLAGPLSGGTVADVDGEACIACPWHGSVFRLRDGLVVHGPATAPQPAFDVRVAGGRVSVSLAGADGFDV